MRLLRNRTGGLLLVRAECLTNALLLAVDHQDFQEITRKDTLDHDTVALMQGY